MKETPRIGRDRLQVAALCLGIQGAERQGRLARARNAGKNHQTVARQLEVDVLQVVLTRATDAHEARTALWSRFRLSLTHRSLGLFLSRIALHPFSHLQRPRRRST